MKIRNIKQRLRKEKIVTGGEREMGGSHPDGKEWGNLKRKKRGRGKNRKHIWNHVDPSQNTNTEAGC